MKVTIRVDNPTQPDGVPISVAGVGAIANRKADPENERIPASREVEVSDEQLEELRNNPHLRVEGGGAPRRVRASADEDGTTEGISEDGES